ncbi:MAG: hypothetical protein Q8M95_12010 [Candidatus Methanoperedens sp.]|nr:hypothetical protein [Candidatus Methanoperedens sp.]
MKCKNSQIDCVTRIITKNWDEQRACEYGIPCAFRDKELNH